ncbi:RNA polymerase sigma-70 factor [Dysgonomonas sp. 511]|uniref:RNA polymerase sigma-70 factor n=1 Tax=Dysgonomonas sp. 511 TaxID=2302930 RepID=UPI0013D1F8B1|nr:RNA polymerase sigma-70 factor [Dysgonomonas sp. 511]NDV79312.1 RNA polymerase sigma-70 factor [Dysgonomonas sp. 511]
MNKDNFLNSNSFNDFYKNNYTKFVHFAYSYIKDMPVSEDFVTESFISCWINKETLGENVNIRAYVLTSIKNKCLNHLRDTQLQENILKKMSEYSIWDREMRINSLEACDPEEIYSGELQALLDKALAVMPEKTLAVFMASRYQDKTYKEIAEEMGLSAKGVGFHITKALKILRTHLKDYIASILFALFVCFFINN